MKKDRHAKPTAAKIVYVNPALGPVARQAAPAERKKRKLNLRLLFLACFSLWALYTFAFVIWPNHLRLEQERQRLERQLSDLRQQEQQLNTEYKNLQDDSYIARLARKYYNMIKQGEIVYRPGE